MFMFLESASQTLNVSFRVKHGDGYYMVYTSFGDVGHKRILYPHRQNEVTVVNAAPAAAGDAPAAVGGGVATGLLSMLRQPYQQPKGLSAARHWWRM